MSKRYYKLAMIGAVTALLASLFISLMLGSASIDSGQLWQVLVADSSAASLQHTIIWQIRMPRLLCAALVGAGLAMCGAILQNVSRNPLADPYLFGLMAGAGLGATLVSVVLPAGHISQALGAFVGALFAVLLVFAACSGKRWQKMETTLLAGVAVSFMLSAISSFILYFAEPFAANRIMFWLMGSLSRNDWFSVWLLLPAVALVLVLALALRRQLDALLLGDDSARTLGVNTVAVRLILLLATALLTAVIVSQCGGIAFVGLMIPHVVRQLFGVTAVPLLLGSVLSGAVFLIWVDNLARTLLPQQEIPLGVITSLLGSVFFLMLMRSRGH
ncbi:MAG: iron ABC transporter permease [Gammaproteobacteria bacterium]|nr:iron ABC transporter permease [Gammaproteobacteria bacterium]MBU1556998.1 iron ABC transporter permease [Gammaproteobacteria bacterium]MBU2069537.1 iron ABC transporter permease [Gammaproteobacteria bacterium]MBU2183083.1 iron ABC transporter permease [Gammaproteobacteria bacterium]MBU2203089.1 iron ABC transporter permease [Gammaproteobacteria bacterium]